MKREDYPWGYDEFGNGRWPLPVTERFGLMERGGLEDGHPPYLMARTEGDVIDVMLCEGDGYRAGYDRDAEDDSQCIYADGDNIPEEWQGTVTNLIEGWLPRLTRGGKTLRFRPEGRGKKSILAKLWKAVKR